VTCFLEERNIHALNLARAAWIFLLVFLGIYVIKEILKVSIHNSYCRPRSAVLYCSYLLLLLVV
jgi:hypothetical protein